MTECRKVKALTCRTMKIKVMVAPDSRLLTPSWSHCPPFSRYQSVSWSMMSWIPPFSTSNITFQDYLISLRDVHSSY
ncbi:rCG37043 [Rattus norvegicus]|uniref:RCG37043 n=1 Tax=Rattus norvegicus TaxID=10116 RepID=A6HUD4_RAT|nr:rCG37043 [Rattus norvegicus]